MQRMKISIMQVKETDRMEGMSMRKIISRFFASLNSSRNTPDKPAGFAEPAHSTTPEPQAHYKWWGDDRYEPV